MTNLIPAWIAAALGEDRLGGSFAAQALFLDISGFTAMTEGLMAHGKDGAEALSKVINEVFDPVLSEIEAGGGFVTTFAGDAFTALFPDPSPDVLETARRMLDVFQRHPDRRTPWGEFALQAKVGLGQGEVEWGILGEAELGYFFRGTAIDAAALAEHRCRPGTIAWADGLRPRPAGADLIEGHVILEPELAAFARRELPIKPELDIAVVARFLPVAQFPRQAGEFRNLSSAFVCFDEKTRPLAETHAALARCARETGGFFNLLDFGDKGGVALVLFGAPQSLEMNLERAMDFSLALLSALPDVRIGIAQGQCFAGYVGSPLRLTYTALGQVVNLSARLATSASPGEILLAPGNPEAVAGYEVRDLGPRSFKGFARPTLVSRLSGRAVSALKYALESGVGREPALKTVSAWLGEVAGGQGGAFVIRGDAGFGKTQLAADALSRFPDLDYQILVCDPVFPHSLNPFPRFFAGLMGPSAEGWADPQSRFETLAGELVDAETPDYLEHEIRRAAPALFPLAGWDLPDAEWAGLDAQARHDRTIEALVAYWSLRARRRPLVLVFENAQALDTETAEFLERVLLRDAGQPLGVLLLSRGPARLSAPTRELALEPFTPEEAVLLVKRTLNAEPTPRLLELLSRRTSRIPLYLSELLRYLTERTLIRVTGQEADFAGDQETGLPRSLEDLVLSQVDRLPAGLKSALPPLAVLGSSFSEPVASALLGDSPGVLQNLLERGLLRRSADGTLSFGQEVLREAVYQLQLGDTLKDWHRRSGETWELLEPDIHRNPGEKAYHFDKAGDGERAKPYFRAEGEEAADGFRNAEALQAFDRFLELSGDNRENSRVRLQKARILELVGDWKTARIELERGIGLLALSGDEDQYFRFFAFLGKIQFKQGDTLGAKASLEKAIRDPRSNTLGPELVQSRIDLARVHLLQGQYGDALARLLDARDLAVEQKFAEEQGLALYYLGVVYRTRNRKTEALATYQKSLEIFRELGRDRLIAYPLYDLSLMAQHEGHLEEAKTYMEEAYRIYAQIGYKSGLGAALINLGAIEDQRGNFGEALDAFRRSRHITEEIGEHLGTAYALFALGATAYKQHEYPRALSALTEAHIMIERLGAESYKGYTLSYLASVLVALERGDDAAARVRQQVEVMAKIGDDVEKGRAYLATAQLLERGLPLSDRGRADLDLVLKASGAPKASAAWFFQAAIRSAREAAYINTLIPATFEYGVYLLGRGRGELGARAIRQAWIQARRGGWTAFLKNLEAKYGDLVETSVKEKV